MANTRKTEDQTHKSVLVNEVLEYLDPKPHGLYVDVTFGAGGHTRAILQRQPTCTVIVIDWDAQALEKNSERLIAEFGARVIPIWGNFAHLYKIFKERSFEKVDGVLADFGTSQEQIFFKEGFSVYRDTPLDMRMSPSHHKITAEFVINKSSLQALQELFSQLGGERHARTIAERIVFERSKKPIATTGQLALLVEQAVGVKHSRIHPATRVFQALRIYVNKELENISAFLPVAVDIVKPGGRIVCISFHSLEDRIVKQFFKERAQKGDVQILTKKIIIATQEEIEENKSARSARLRAVQRA